MKSWEQIAVYLAEQNETLTKLCRSLIDELATYRDVEREEQQYMETLRKEADD